MILYLAGGISGNLFPQWRRFLEEMDEAATKEMKIYLVNQASRRYVIEKNPTMDLYIAGDNGTAAILKREIIDGRGRLSLKKMLDANTVDGASDEGHPVYDINILESFYYARKNKVIGRLIPYYSNFLLDSGAFTFMVDEKNKCDWDEYTEEYAQYICEHNIERFFELDIDSVVGIKEVERLRAKLERMTNRRSIPVWHVQRGKEYYIRMCREYDYIAFGGILTDGKSRQELEKYFPWFINTAHSHGAKIHGLGYTGNLKKYRFDSVDSTAWLYGNRGGYLYKFDRSRGVMDKIEAPEKKRLKPSEAALHNFNEWLKYSQWAKNNL